MENILQIVRRPLRLATAGISGILAGAMLVIKIVLVPFWRDAPPREFRAWFGQHSARIRGLMVPLGAAGLGVSGATAALEARRKGAPGPAAVAAGASAGVVAITLSVNEPANAKFEQADFDDEQTAELLRKWSRWHDVRVSLGLIATAAAVITAASSRA
jgi:Domain of unknown function (DUF1772)